MFSDMKHGEVQPTDFFFLQDFRKCSIYALCVKAHAKLADDEAAPQLQQASVGTKQLQEVDHKYLEVSFFRARRDLC
jgi:hypothetical protein